MVLDDTKLYDMVWDRVFTQLHFNPDSCLRTHSFHTNIPFEIDDKFSVYGLEKMKDTHLDIMDYIIRNIFIDITKENERMYALDWEHSGFLYNPRNKEEQKSIWMKDDRYLGGGYNAYFPPFFPDADYYFFIDENFRFGYLGHPWRQEVWIFGELLLHKFEQIYPKLGWIKLK